MAAFNVVFDNFEKAFGVTAEKNAHDAKKEEKSSARQAKQKKKLEDAEAYEKVVVGSFDDDEGRTSGENKRGKKRAKPQGAITPSPEGENSKR